MKIIRRPSESVALPGTAYNNYGLSLLNISMDNIRLERSFLAVYVMARSILTNRDYLLLRIDERGYRAVSGINIDTQWPLDDKGRLRNIWH